MSKGFWIGVAHRRQALAARAAGFCAFSHGKREAAERVGTDADAGCTRMVSGFVDLFFRLDGTGAADHFKQPAAELCVANIYNGCGPSELPASEAEGI